MTTSKVIADELWAKAKTLVEPPQVCIVIVTDPSGTVVCQNNRSLGELVVALREVADKYESIEDQVLELS